jgi:dihydrofolate reductase
MNALPKYVATRSLATPDWNATFLPGDAVEAVARLREDPGTGTLLVNGSGVLLRALIADDLVDELRVMLYPVLVGKGARLFAEEDETLRSWTLREHRISASGVAILFYEPARSA